MKNFIYAAGYDYEFNNNDFAVLARRRMEATINKYKGTNDELHFTIFDFANGKILRDKVSLAAGGKPARTPSTTTPYRAIDRSDYRQTSGKPALKDDTPGIDKIMSILDVYREIESIGRQTPGTLQELSVFSHGWAGGAVLVNSYISKALKRSGHRDPKDKDARISDFADLDWTEARARVFKSAYASDAINWLWGCSFPTDTHGLLHKITNHRVYNANSVSAKARFVFAAKALTDDEIAVLTDSLGFDGATIIQKDGSIALTFKQIKDAFVHSNESTYAYKLATASGRTTFGAPVGTFSGFEPGGLMNVSKTVGSYVNFYRKHLKFAFDDTKRRYARFPTPNTQDVDKP